MKDALTRLRGVHDHLARIYADASRGVAEERARLMLDDMRREELEVGASITRFLEEGSPNVLETWLQYEPDPTLEKSLSEGLPHDLNPDAIFERVMSIEDRISDVHRQLAGVTAAPAVQELFDALVAIDTRRRRRYSRDVLESP